MGLVALVALASVGLAVGLVLLAAAIRGGTPRPAVGQAARQAATLGRLVGGRRLQMALAGGGALTVALLTRWPVGALLAGAVGWAWPTLFAARKTSEAAIARIEAVAAWTEMLRGMVVSAASVEQAIVATVPRAPAPIREEVEQLAGRLRRGGSLMAALREFADAIGDDVGDLVGGALLLAADPSQNIGGLGRLLAELALRARQKAGYRRRVLTGRAHIDASARAITVITLSVVAALLVFARGFLAPYATATGQAALLVVGAVFALGFALLARLGRVQAAQRFLGADQRPPGANQ